MKHELKDDFYDNVYLIEKKYQEHYSKSPYYEMWKSIIPNIKSIADFGCGVGQFAEMCLDNDILYSYGVDFSKVAIDECHRLETLDFYYDNLYNKHVYTIYNYETAVFLETLEHITFDLDVIRHVPKGKKIVISVPNWDSLSHVRYFQSSVTAIGRYKDLIHIEKCDIFPIGNKGKEIYVLYGTVK